MLDTHARRYVQPLFDNIAKIFIKLNIRPIQITIFSLIIGLASVISLYFDLLLLSVILLWISGLMDVLDGTVARLNDQKSDLGAFLDITFDRIVELGIIISLALSDNQLSTMLVFLTSSVVMSMTIFLTIGNFAKNHTKKSFYYQAGVAERTEGFIFFTLIILMPNYRTIIGYIFTSTVLFTASQRFLQGIFLLKED